jgi:hypothetical protein
MYPATFPVASRMSFLNHTIYYVQEPMELDLLPQLAAQLLVYPHDGTFPLRDAKDMFFQQVQPCRIYQTPVGFDAVLSFQLQYVGGGM